jgi:predicted cupin superfamily sugar epimerase
VAPRGRAADAHVGATVGSGFDFADFAFVRQRAEAAALNLLAPALARLF